MSDILSTDKVRNLISDHLVTARDEDAIYVSSELELFKEPENSHSNEGLITVCRKAKSLEQCLVATRFILITRFGQKASQLTICFKPEKRQFIKAFQAACKPSDICIINIKDKDGKTKGVKAFNTGEITDAFRYTMETSVESSQLLSETAPPENCTDYAINALKIEFDNPGGEWLKRKIEYVKDRHPAVSSITAWFAKRSLAIDLKVAVEFKGFLGEENFRRTDSRYEYLMKNFDPDKVEAGVLIGVLYNGECFIIEGNHRIQAAHDLGYKNIRAEVRYFDGGELRDGTLSINKLTEDGPIQPFKEMVLDTEDMNENCLDTMKRNAPTRDSSGGKKFKVCGANTGDDKGKLVRFGDSGMSIKAGQKNRRDSYRARAKCDNVEKKGDKTSASYWSCKAWPKSGKTPDWVSGKSSKKKK